MKKPVSGRILVIRLSSLGDVARLLPSLAALKAAPEVDEVSLTVEDRFAGLLDLFPVADRVITYPRKGAPPPLRRPLAWRKAMKSYFGRLKQGRYDLALDLHGILRSALVARFSGAETTAGYARGFGKEGSHLLYRQQLRPAEKTHISRYERYAGALACLGVENGQGGYLSPKIPAGSAREVSGFLKDRHLERGEFIFAFIGTSRAQQVKRWPLDSFVALAEHTYRVAGLPTVVGWGPEEEKTVKAVPPKPFLHVPPLLELASLVDMIQRARIFVGADTGSSHLAALMGVPTVMILGPTDPVINRPFGERARIVHKPGIHSLCRGARCNHRHCMGAISEEEVFDVMQEVMEAP